VVSKYKAPHDLKYSLSRMGEPERLSASFPLELVVRFLLGLLRSSSLLPPSLLLLPLLLSLSLPLLDSLHTQAHQHNNMSGTVYFMN
jgi:hypothetical protein